MNYNLSIGEETVGTDLSRGEVNQWILDLSRELRIEDRHLFKTDFGFQRGKFEDFIYSDKLKFPVFARFGDKIITIEESQEL